MPVLNERAFWSYIPSQIKIVKCIVVAIPAIILLIGAGVISRSASRFILRENRPGVPKGLEKADVTILIVEFMFILPAH